MKAIFYFFLLSLCLTACKEGTEPALEAQLSQATDLAASKLYDEALDIFENVLVQNHQHSDALVGVAKMHYKMGDYNKALQKANHLIETDPKQIDHYLLRGNIYLRQKETYKALKDFNAAVKINTRYYLALNDRAMAYLELEKYSEALKDLNTSILLEPSNASAYYNRGQVKIKQKEARKAIYDYNQALHLNPDLLEAYLMRGLAYLKLKNNMQAFQDYNEVIEREPQNDLAYSYRAHLFFVNLNFKAALRDYNQAISINALKATYYYSRSLTKYMLGKKNKKSACIDLENALELGLNVSGKNMRKIKTFCEMK